MPNSAVVFRTVEVRWFRAGRCPPPVWDWFHTGAEVGEPEQRTDAYLQLADRDDLGVKLRGGSILDLKLRTGSDPGAVLPAGLDGVVEAWAKWSFPVDPAGAAEPARSWISVEKVRRARTYGVNVSGTAASVPGGAVVPNGCAAELVEVRIGLHRSWGFGLEAFGSDLDPGAILAAAASALLADTPLPGFTFPAADSHSYPSWLRRWPEPE